MNPTSRFARLSSLLLWAWMALTGCDPSTPSTPVEEQNYADVQFDVAVPPETPVTATLYLWGEDPAFKGPGGRGLELIYQGGTTFTAKTRVLKQKEVSFTVRMTSPDAHVPLTLAGTAAGAGTHTAREAEEKVEVVVERWGPPEGLTGPSTVFLVEVPATTAPGANVWLSGNEPGLGSWNGAGVKLYKAMNSLYAASLSFEAGTSLEFKATLGCWETVEKDAMGEELDNRVHTTGEGYERFPLTVESWAASECPPPEPPPEPTITGLVKYHLVKPANAVLKERDVIVWLPPGYEEPENEARRYPVLYMHDGQNLMNVVTAFGHVEWNVDETAEALVAAGKVEPVIIVGIYNAGVDRIPEYTQTPVEKYKGSGRADLYGDFLVNELKPLIDGTYRTRPEGRYTGLAGSSLGGLVSMYLGMKYPDTFTRLGVISPSVWWDDRDILGRVAALAGPLPLRVWVDIGTDEGSDDEAETVQDATALHQALLDKGWSATDVSLKVYDGAEHSEAAWSQRFGEVLEFLYPAIP